MRSKFYSALTACLMLSATQQQAQVSNYSFTQTLSTYGSPNTGTLVGAQLQDDDANTVALPFPFVYNSTSYSSITVGSNGNLSFSSLSGGEYYAISDNSTQNVIAPFSQDLWMGTIILADMTAGSNTLINCSSVAGFSVGDVLQDWAGDFNSNPTITSISGNIIVLNQNAINSNTSWDIVNGTNGYIKQNVSGATPNRICEFEYANFSRYGEYNEVINFKVRLYETSNKIEFVYGNMIPSSTSMPSEVGLKGTGNDFNSRKVVSPTTWSNSVASSTITDAADFSSALFPLNGQSYLWAPLSCTVPILTIAPSNSVSCPGQTVVLTASGAATYSWVNGSSAAQQTITPTSTTTYTLIGANTTCTASLTYTQQVTPNPSLTVATSATNSCAGQSLTLTATGATSYSWNAVAGSSQTVVTPSASTTYTLLGANGTCTAQSLYTQTVTAYPVLTVATTPSVICAGDTATITVSGATSYSYNNVAGTSSLVITPSVTTTYTITGANLQCASTQTVTQNVMTNCVVTGIKETSFENSGISAYPNPFGSALNINNTSEKELMVTISDAVGKEVYSSKIKAGSVETISVDALNSGLYLISVQGGKGMLTKKLIKQ